MIGLGVFLGLAVALSVFFTIIAAGKWARLVMLAATTVIALVTLAGMFSLIILMVSSPANINAHRLLTTGVGIWVFNIIVFAVLYHEMGEGDFSFPRAERSANRQIVFLDYLFLSFTTATAFSPTDMSPLTTKARMAMMLEATISLATLAIVAARAVNILK